MMGVGWVSFLGGIRGEARVSNRDIYCQKVDCLGQSPGAVLKILFCDDCVDHVCVLLRTLRTVVDV